MGDVFNVPELPFGLASILGNDDSGTLETYPTACADHAAAMAAANSAAPAKCPPPSPSTPTKSVSQNWQMACSRSSSRPVHKLQPAKRQNTAARPDRAPSP